MSLESYEQARPWAKSIRERVITRQMPPWHIDKTVGIQKFKNDRSLSDAQIDTIVKWVDAGAAKGDAKDMPPPKQWPDESKWNFAPLFGAPDLVIKSPDWTVPPVGLDAWYKPVVATGLNEPRWVRAIEIRPATVKGRKITHHALARLQQEEPNNSADDVPGVGGLFMEWAVGKQGEQMRPDTGKLMLPGSKIIFEMHYHSVGEQITDHVELGIYFYPKGQEPKFSKHRYSAEPDFRQPELHSNAASGPNRELSAAHAPARQGHVDGSHSANRSDDDAEPCKQLQFQLA
jgi:hypothetical protein